MPQILPFSAWRYNPDKISIEDVIAPPYDVVSEKEIKYFKEKSPYNIFHLELPESYERAKELLHSWIKEEILVKKDSPAIYLYELQFSYQGKTYLRKGFINLVKLSPFEEGKVLPHEKVYPKVTEDRFELFKTTGFQFSQIFALYEDPELYLFEGLENKKELLYEVSFNKEKHSLFKITDKNIIKKISDFLKDKKIYIADGHHRYTTGLKYKEYMESLYGKDELKDYNYIAMYLCPIEDKNLLMLPTHRLYYLENFEEILRKLKNFASELKEIEIKKPFELENFFKNSSCEWIIVTQEKAYFFRLKPEVFEKIKEKEPVLSEITLYNFLQVFEDITEEKEEAFKEKGKVEFLSEAELVIDKAKKGAIGIIFPRLSPLVLKKAAQAQKRMPHKCTYFYPKILTGMVLNEISGKTLQF